MNALLQGDCLDILPLLPDGCVDMVCCDPPYGTTQCKWDSIIPLSPLWVQLKRVVKPDGAIIMMAAQPFTSALVMSNLDMFRYDWVWAKNKATGHLNAKKAPLKNHESVLVFYQHQPHYQPRMTDGHLPMNRAFRRVENCQNYGVQKSTISNAGTTQRYPKTIQEFAVVNNDSPDRIHPQQKPVELMGYLIKTYTVPGDTVLDFSMGSGTTGEACHNLTRDFIGIEKDFHNFTMAKERIDAL